MRSIQVNFQAIRLEDGQWLARVNSDYVSVSTAGLKVFLDKQHLLDCLLGDVTSMIETQEEKVPTFSELQDHNS